MNGAIDCKDAAPIPEQILPKRAILIEYRTCLMEEALKDIRMKSLARQAKRSRRNWNLGTEADTLFARFLPKLFKEMTIPASITLRHHSKDETYEDSWTEDTIAADIFQGPGRSRVHEPSQSAPHPWG